MNKNTNLSKIRDCGQIWDTMSDCKGGKQCTKCNETIYDFRGMTDWEIAIKHSEHKMKVCGIYDTNKIHRKSDKTERNYANTKLKTIALIGSLTSSIISSGQSNDQQIISNPITVPINANETNLGQQKIRKESATAKDSTMVVMGVIKDMSKEVVIGANIIIQGTDRGTITDINGEYSLDISDEFSQNDSIKLIFQYIGYAREEEVITKSDFLKNDILELDIVFDESPNLTVFRVRRLPWYKRIWNKIFR